MGSLRKAGGSRRDLPALPRWAWYLAAGLPLVFVMYVAAFGHRSPAYVWKPGNVTVYDLTYQSSAAARPEALFNSTQPHSTVSNETLAYAFAARLRATVVSSTPQRERMVLQFAQARVKLLHNGLDDADGAARLARDIDIDVDVTLLPTGKIESLRFPAETSSVDSAMLRAVISLLQVVTGPQGAHAWSAIASDPDGGHRADYAVNFLQNAFSPTIVIQEMTHSLPAPVFQHTNKRFLRPYVNADGNFYGRFDPAGFLASLQGTLTTTSTLSGQLLSASKSVLSLQEVRRETLNQRQLAQLAVRVANRAKRVKAIGFVFHRSHAAVERQTYTSTLGPDDLRVLIRALADAQNRSEHYLFGTLEPKFEALFFLDPAASARLEPVLLAANTRSATFRVLVSALGGAGTSQAQATLRHVIRLRRNETQAVSMLIGNLTVTSHPDPRTVALLETIAAGKLMNDAPITAILALGTVAQRLSDSDVRSASAIVHALSARLATTTLQHGRIVLLQALGNAGLPEAKSAILAYRHDPNVDIRAAAVYSLRDLHGEVVDAMLRSAVSDDPSENVRSAAVSAFGYHRIRTDDFLVLAHAARYDSDSQVRIPAINAIWSVRSEFPDAYGVVKTIAQSDSKKVVRHAAQQMLLMDHGA